MSSNPAQTVEPPAAPTGDGAPGESTGFTARQKRRGSKWTLVGFGGSQALRFLSTIVLTRLLFKEAYGLQAIVGTFLTGLHLFTDLGLPQCVVQHPRGHERVFRNTAWTMQLVRGCLLAVAAIGLSGVVARAYGHAELQPLIAVGATTVVLNSLASTSLYMLRRQMNVRALAMLELTSQTLGIATSIVWAWLAPSAWAFVGGSIVTAGSMTLMSHVLLDGRDRLGWDRDVFRALASFGAWIFVSTMTLFLSEQTDRLLFGALMPLELLGVYGIALTAATIPARLLEELIDRVAFPELCRGFRDGTSLRPVFREQRRMVAAVGGWMIGGICAGAPLIVDILYDDRYADAGWMLRITAVSVWFGHVLEHPRRAGVIACGLPRILVATHLGKFVAVLGFVAIGHWLDGYRGMLIGYAAANAVKYAITAWCGRRLGLGNIVGDGIDSLRFGAGAALAVLALQPCAAVGLPVVLQCVVVFVVVTLVWLPRLLPVLHAGRSHDGPTAG